MKEKVAYMFNKRVLSGGAVLVVALMFANFLNFVFNAFLGRQLDAENFGTVTLLNTILALIMVFMAALGLTVTHKVAYISAKSGISATLPFLHQITKQGIFASLLLTVIWIAIIPFTASFFNIESTSLLLVFSPVILFGTLATINRGFLHGKFSFKLVAIIVVAEALSKLIFATLLVYLNLDSLVAVSIPLSIFITFLLSLIVVHIVLKDFRNITQNRVLAQKFRFPNKFFIASIFVGLSTAAFLSIDIILAKHYLDPVTAGEYALLSLVGKIIFFLGTLISSFVVTFASSDEGKGKDPSITFYKLLFGTTVLTIISFLCLGLLGEIFVPLLFGDNAYPILGFLIPYTLAIALFTVSNSIVKYHLALKNYAFPFLSIVISILLFWEIVVSHDSILTITHVVLKVSLINFILGLTMHVFYAHFRIKGAVEHDFVQTPKNIKEKLCVSICVPAHNEEKNIGTLLSSLLSQKTKHIIIEHIVVVSSGSTDGTTAIVKKFKDRDNRIALIEEMKRNGKAEAINKFLDLCPMAKVVVVQSADTVCKEDTIENLCLPFLIDEGIGMTGGAPVPVNDKNTFLGYIVHSWWWFHRNIPRFGEIIAFRNVIGRMPKTSVDEAYIQAQMMKKGYKLMHVDHAVVSNKGPEHLRDIIKQRRRIHNGHSRLLAEEGVVISNITSSSIQLLLLHYRINSPKELLWILGGIIIETYTRFLGFYDKTIGKKNPVVWEIASSTKNLNIHKKDI
ncbi:MAG: glycosyltransferase [Candidatus Roizmanbacteria bacterium]|nr:glycosyltransferase [Candidatus Roizmanbacteria bacterium]